MSDNVFRHFADGERRNAFHFSALRATFEVKIPEGTQVYVGEVGSQGGVFVGGAQQIVVPKPWAIDGVEVINSSPLK